MADLRTELHKIYREHNRLTPRLVLETARNPEHPLHSRFEWNDGVAAEKYRLDQARTLIAVVKVRYRDAKDAPQQVRRWHNIQRDSGNVYEPVEEILDDPIATKILLGQMRREWQAMKARYSRFSEFRDMVLADMIDTDGNPKDGDAA